MVAPMMVLREIFREPLGGIEGDVGERVGAAGFGGVVGWGVGGGLGDGSRGGAGVGFG